MLPTHFLSAKQQSTSLFLKVSLPVRFITRPHSRPILFPFLMYVSVLFPWEQNAGKHQNKASPVIHCQVYIEKPLTQVQIFTLFNVTIWLKLCTKLH